MSYILLKLELYLFLFMSDTIGYPIDTFTDDAKPEEIHFSNGTILGKYIYTDNEGNPIHVKYYADNSSYGVELKSVKVIDSTTDDPQWLSNSNNFDFKTLDNHPFEHKKSVSYSIIDDTPTKTTNKAMKSKGHSTSPSDAYEVFYEKEINVPQGHCGEDKIKIYYEKEKRMVRDVLDYYQAPKYFDQF